MMAPAGLNDLEQMKVVVPPNSFLEPLNRNQLAGGAASDHEGEHESEHEDHGGADGECGGRDAQERIEPT